jgi:HK97 family phage prohead protease
MPYYITGKNAECDGWAVVDGGDGFYGCHTTKTSAIKQAVAISLSTDEPFEGERAAVGQLKIGDYVSWNVEDPTILAQVVEVSGEYAVLRVFEEENMVFSPEDKLMILNILKLKRIQKPEMIAYEADTMEEDPEEPESMIDPNEPMDLEENLIEDALEEDRAEPNALSEGDFVSWNSSGGRARGRIEYIMREGTLGIPDSSFSINATPEDPAALIRIYREADGEWNETETLVGHRFSTLTKIQPLTRSTDLEDRAVNLTPPAFMRAAARQGLRYYEQGLGGDGLVDSTIREARAMAAGNVTADKWVRMGAWIARHTSDLDAPAANPSNEDYPSAGVVAHLLWGSGPSKRSAQRALDYANRVKTKLEEENRAKISVESESMAKVEQRISVSEFEIREDEAGMTFEGYAAIFDSPSEPLPFIERIKRGAFNRSLKQARNDIKLLWNHDTSAVLGSTRAGTLKLVEDDKGLRVSATLPNTTSGRDAAVLLKRGDVDSMSFGFSVPAGGDTWNQEGTERTLKSVRLHEVSIVAFPAYTSTAGTTSVRGLAALAERASLDVDELADAMLLLEEGKDLTPEAAELLRTAISELAPKPEQISEVIAEDAGDLGMLDLKKLKLKLMEM